ALRCRLSSSSCGTWSASRSLLPSRLQSTGVAGVICATKPLDPQHAEFLCHANGWNSFSADIDLFGTTDFCGSNRFRQAREWVKMMHRGALGNYAKQRSSMLPIAKISASTDLLLMIQERGKVQPKVLGVTNELIEEFDDFNQMFVSFKAYQQQAIDYWLKRNQSGAP
ncbi:hypothetical protein, partial [Paracidovorax anthurii]|uniref:hypothetical protein n=1 Tax=Paracidovorax anthurii TaxID=78229 RepID=UPI0039F0CBE8